MESMTLFELNSLVSRAIETTLPDSFWVEAELMEIREVRGHCYMELVQKDMFSATPVAKASAKCWQSSWVKVQQKFRKTAGSNPMPGMQLLVKAKVNFHPTYGYSLIISDIDPTYTVGDMARKRQEIIDQLKAEGVFELQKELTLPLFCKRVAVISAANAAGYGDFYDQLLNNECGFCFEVTLFSAVMQGALVEESVCAALDEINALQDDFDCVVIIRGGGATSDMSGFDTLRLAEYVANFPLPIITGIGHDRDESVLDLISFHRVKTPTAAAAFLIDHLADVNERIDEAETVIVNAVNRQIERQHLLLENLLGKITNCCRLLKQNGETKLMRIHLKLENTIAQRLLNEKHRLAMLEQRVSSLDPRLLLKRGYSMTVSNGRIVKDAAELKAGDEIVTILEKGKIVSSVKETKE
ncbi:MAG: exodeoxyribonuclease VII large subunit [Prevotellaceae bacterium]|nr:exodeoxyribonuclease VII large subunit [Prevotellaceae bacterium]